MASLVLKMSVSLDGFVAPVDGSTDWVAAGRSDDGASWTGETLSKAGAHLMGATTYAGWAAYWQGASGPFAMTAGAAALTASGSMAWLRGARARPAHDSPRDERAVRAGRWS